MKTCAAVALVVVLAGVMVSLAWADTIYVDVTNNTGVEDGSAANPYNTIQEGIDAASNGHEVIVAEGEYDEAITFDGSGITADFTLRSTDPTNPAVVAATVINHTGDPMITLFVMSGAESDTCLISGLTITSPGVFGAIYGGGTEAGLSYCVIRDMYTQYFPVSGWDGAITNCTITGNRVCDGSYTCGGLYNCDGDITDCIISDNWGGCSGGLRECDGTISGCTISGNTANLDGGGLYGCDGAITDCTINGNSAGRYGGGLYDCDGAITDCTISDNEALYDDCDGGGLYGCDGAITCCTISGNAADQYGGGLFQCAGDITDCEITGNSSGSSGGGLNDCNGAITGCTVTDNDSDAKGGGISNCGGAISDCDISGNTAYSHGGGIYRSGSSIGNCTITGNTSGACGGAAYESGAMFNCLMTGNAAGDGVVYTCAADITNCTIADNWCGAAALHYCTGAITDCVVSANAPTVAQVLGSSTPTYSCIENWTGGGTGNTADDPLLAAAPVGGCYLSHVADGQATDSPCIDAGSDTAVNLGLDTRTTRTSHAVDTGVVDMGYHHPVLPPVSYNGLEISQGWSLIGSGCPGPVPLACCVLTDGVEAKLWDDAVMAGWLQTMLYYYETGVGYCECRTDGAGDDDQLRGEYGYWLLTYQADLRLIIPAP